ncbi:MAG: PAS domain-containing protein [Propionibacteriaceae bacterium]|nr:PAS domain-containing protein [Propionibacteriaceae bacterium]
MVDDSVIDDSVTWPTMDRIRDASGLRHEIGPGQLFFSMTDPKGVITAANSVFVQMARFTRSELIGSPHSIIRHPDMPAAAFRLMWDEIQQGRPFCCYVDNLAADGSTYTVFATVTPTTEGYLSVRVRPLRDDLLERARSLYRPTRQVERAARQHGVNRRGAAGVGLDKLQELLGEAGLPNYDEFQWVALLAEVEARRDLPGGLETRPHASGPLAAMLICCHTLSAELRHWSSHQAAIQQMAHSISEAIPHLLDAASSAIATATVLQQARPRGAERSGALAFLASRLTQMSSITNELVRHLLVLRQSCRDTRSWVALAELHTAALGQFVVEILDQGQTDQTRSAVEELCQVLDDDFTFVSELSEENAVYAGTMTHELQRVHALIADHREVVNRVKRELDLPAADQLDRLVPQITDQLDAVEDALRLIEHLGRESTTISTPLDTHTAEFQVAHLLEVMDSLP